MAHLNQAQREQLLNEIKDKRYPQIRGILNGKDKKARLAFFRNAQLSGKWMTRYVLESLGTQVTIIEAPVERETKKRPRRNYQIAEIIVEPTPDNEL